MIKMKEKVMVQFTGKQCIRNYRDHSEKRVNENFRIKIGFIIFIREATKQDSNIANNSRGEWVYIRTIQDTLMAWLLCPN